MTDPEDATPAAGPAGESPEEAAREEREFVRERVRAELGREPTEAEVDDWLRQHTESY
ncbi:MAG TPA: hypothetical protein VFC61_06445 [Blastocatellia bacterium]|jgi:hypothetical protein|nr:hypothetical protein [Blastocatellia bacterium]